MNCHQRATTSSRVVAPSFAATCGARKNRITARDERRCLRRVGAIPDGVRYDYTSEDERYMLRAIELANTVTYEEHTNPNPIVGCVLVDPTTNEIVGEGYHPKAGEPHAEVHALRAAGKKAKGATAYVTLEPCNHFGRTAACSRALVDAGVKRVLIGAYDTDPRVAGGGMKTLLDRGIEVVCGCKEREATEMNRAFFDRIERERLEKERKKN